MFVIVKRPTLGLAAALSVMLAAASAPAADGQALFADKGCTACHGEDAKTPLQEGYPRLAGLNADYLMVQMKDIKSGARANGQTVDTMKPIVEDLDEAQMRSLADYLASLAAAGGPTATADAAGKTLYQSKTCTACHGREGKKPILKTYPALAGQDPLYLTNQMKDIKSGARANGGTNAMRPVMHLVTDDEIAAIAGYLSGTK